MNDKFIAEFEQALKNEIEQKKQALDAEYRRRLDAFKVACGTSVNDSYSVFLATATGSGQNGHRFFGGGEAIPNEPTSVLKAVKEALKHVEGSFTVRDLVPAIKALYPTMEIETKDLSNPLWMLSRDGEIEKVVAGLGRDPHTYKKRG